MVLTANAIGQRELHPWSGRLYTETHIGWKTTSQFCGSPLHTQIDWVCIWIIALLLVIFVMNSFAHCVGGELIIYLILLLFAVMRFADTFSVSPQKVQGTCNSSF